MAAKYPYFVSKDTYSTQHRMESENIIKSGQTSSLTNQIFLLREMYLI